MASSSTSSYSSWIGLANDQVTEATIHDVLAPLHDDLWVAAACADRCLDDLATQRALLELGISRTNSAVERCKDVISLSSTSEYDPVRAHFQNTPNDARLCHIRSILLGRLDRLQTYAEAQDLSPASSTEDNVDPDMDEWEDDPWGDGGSAAASRAAKSAAGLAVSLSSFLQNDLLLSACELASSQSIVALQVLLRRHNSELWPYRFKILEAVPEQTDPELCRDIFPTVDFSTGHEARREGEAWRKEIDFSELPEVQNALADNGFPSLRSKAEGWSGAAADDVYTLDQLSIWYKARVDRVISNAGLVDVALSLVQHATSQGIPSLDELGEELSLLSRLVYDAQQAPDFADDWTLSRWSKMDTLAVVRAYLSHSTPETLADDISRLVMPYLFVMETRAERSGTPDPSLPTRILYDYVLTTSLENVAIIFENSKPTIPHGQRIIKDDEDMARIALACLYGSDKVNEWQTMSRIFECLPVWDLPPEVGADEADMTVASLGAFLTPTTTQPRCTAKDLLLFFTPLPIASLSRALDILDVHLESGEILSRWGVAAPLRWLLQSSDDLQEQRAWANRMARRAGGDEDRLDTVEGWEWLLEDMLKLANNGEPGFRGAFNLLSKEEVMKIFLLGLLSTGAFPIARTLLHRPHSKITLPESAIEEVCLNASHEFYDNASSGNYHTGDMKLAFECLDVPKPTPAVVKEKEFIEATSRICSFNVYSSPGTPIAPIEIRLTKDRLTLISRVLSSSDDAYKHSGVILDLCQKLGYKNDVVAEVKVLAMLADTALQAEDFTRAYENNERMVQIVTSLRNASPGNIAIDDEKLREVVGVCWIACFQLGRHPEFDDLQKKMRLLGSVLELCPSDKLHDVLTAWRKLEGEDLAAREAKLNERRDRMSVTKPREQGNAAMTVASSLRARLQELHMPSPPMLNTPDAAALASKTFKSVAANFPFGHRGRSQASDTDERSSVRSESSRMTDLTDVSAQATKVFSKGIGWLIGTDDEY